MTKRILGILAALLYATQAFCDAPPTRPMFTGTATITTSAPLPALDAVTNCDATNGAVTITLPASLGNGDWAIVEKIDSTANACTVTAQGSDTIDGQVTTLDTQYGSLTLYSRQLGQWGMPANNVSVVGAGTTGNAAYYSGRRNLSPIANVIHAGSGTLYAALAACPTNGQECDIIADPGYTYTLSSPFILGRAAGGSYALPQNLIVQGAISCADTTAGQLDDCIVLGTKARLSCASHQTAGSGGTITATSTANLNAVIDSFGGVVANVWQANHTYLGGQIVVDANSNTEEVTTPTPGSAGTATSGNSTPSWPAVNSATGTTTIDGGVTWTLIATAASGRGPGTNDTRLSIYGCDINGNTAASINSVLHVSAVDGLGTVDDVVVGNLPNGSTGVLVDDGSTNAACTGSGTPWACCTASGAGSCASSLLNSECTASLTPFACCTGSGTGSCGTGSFSNAINFDSLWIAPGSTGGAGPNYLLRVTSALGGVGPTIFKNASIVDLKGTSTTADTISIDTAGTNLADTDFYGLYVELASGSSATNGLVATNARGTHLWGAYFNHNGNSTVTNCLNISGTNTDNFFVEGRVSGSTCTTPLTNGISSQSVSTLGSILYSYTKSGQGANPLFDGLALNSVGGFQINGSNKGFPLVTGTVSVTAPTAVGCTDATATATGATTSNSVSVTPQANPNGTSGNVTWQGYISAANTVDVRVCTLSTETSPPATTYNWAVYN